MNPQRLRSHGDQVHRFARAVPNMGRVGELTDAIYTMLESKAWRDYRDATGAYHFLPAEYDYFLALQTVEARDVARLYLRPEQRAALAAAMDHAREEDRRARRSLDAVIEAHPHAGDSLRRYWEQYGWSRTYPLGQRAVLHAQKGLTNESQAKQARLRRLTALGNGWHDRVARVVATARTLNADELRMLIDELRDLARTRQKAESQRHREWQRDAEELNYSVAACTKRWSVSPGVAKKRLQRLK